MGQKYNFLEFIFIFCWNKLKVLEFCIYNINHNNNHVYLFSGKKLKVYKFTKSSNIKYKTVSELNRSNPSSC